MGRKRKFEIGDPVKVVEVLRDNTRIAEEDKPFLDKIGKIIKYQRYGDYPYRVSFQELVGDRRTRLFAPYQLEKLEDVPKPSPVSSKMALKDKSEILFRLGKIIGRADANGSEAIQGLAEEIVGIINRY